MAEQPITDKAIHAVTQLVRSSGAPQEAPGGTIPFVVIPQDAKVESLEKMVYNDHTAKPERIRQAVSVLDPESFIEYYTLFHDENSRVFAYEPTISVVAALDYHGAGEGAPRWCQHRLTLTLRESEEWRVWTAHNNKQKTQMEFAEFLEQYSVDIAKPNPAAMMEVARDLQATTEVDFAVGSRTQDGQVRFKYTETTKATVGGGKLDVPERFTLTIPIFVGGQRIDVDALLRYRVNGGKLVIWYTLIRAEEAKRTAFLAARQSIADALKITVINGTL